MNREAKNLKMILAALFLALAYLLPFVTGQIPEVGKMLCPMHIPVLLCGFICGPFWGAAVGVVAPLLRSLTLGVPLFFPSAVCMALELAAYGALTGLLHRLLPRKKRYIYPSLLLSMVGGRLIWGAAMFVCMGLSGKAFGFTAFLAGAVTGALPGIALQLVLVPAIVLALERFALKGRLL